MLCTCPPCKQLLPLSAAAAAKFPPLPPLQGVDGRWPSRCCPNLPHDSRQGGSTSAPLFSVLNSREKDSVRITALQLLWAPSQAWTHVYAHIAHPYTGISPHLLCQARTPGEKDIHTSLRYFCSCGNSFTEGWSLLSKIARTLLCSQAHENSYSQYLWFSSKSGVLF